MKGFEEGFKYFEKNVSALDAAYLSDDYINKINIEIEKLTDDLNSFKNFASNTNTLKGDVAEFWHAGTFNIDAALNNSSNRAYVNRSHDHASIDISTNFGKDYGLKYDRNGIESAKQQAKSIFEKFKEYEAKGGKDSIDEYLLKRGYSDDTILDDPIYSGQIRLIPSDQVKEAINYLKLKIAKEQLIRPEQVKRYQETLDLLTDCIKDNKGNKSIRLSKDMAERLADNAKKGEIDLSELGLSAEELINYEYILEQAFKAGLSAATIAMAIKVAPEIIKAIKYLIDEGEIDKEQFENIGFAAISGSADGFIKGAVSSALTTFCKAGLFGETLKEIDPSIIGLVVVLTVDTMKNAYNVAIGKMTRRELANCLIKEMFISTCSIIGGNVSQAFIDIPVLGFMIGSLVGSIVGSVTYEVAYRPVISFCISTGFTMFGLVEQDYTLPDDVLKEIGTEVFEYEKFESEQFESEKFESEQFQSKRFESETIDIVYLRRGVLGINKIGYLI